MGRSLPRDARPTLRLDLTRAGFAVGIVITTPPFPYRRDTVPVPVGFELYSQCRSLAGRTKHVHYGEVALQDEMFVTSGASGYTLFVTGTGETIEAARDAATRWQLRLSWQCALSNRYRYGA